MVKYDIISIIGGVLMDKVRYLALLEGVIEVVPGHKYYHMLEGMASRGVSCPACDSNRVDWSMIASTMFCTDCGLITVSPRDWGLRSGSARNMEKFVPAGEIGWGINRRGECEICKMLFAKHQVLKRAVSTTRTKGFIICEVCSPKYSDEELEQEVGSGV